MSSLIPELLTADVGNFKSGGENTEYGLYKRIQKKASIC